MQIEDSTEQGTTVSRTVASEHLSVPLGAELKAKWLADLRGGTLKQAQSALHDGEGYCCLGVLERLRGVDDETLLKRCAELWLNNSHDTPDLLTPNQRRKLADLNDEGSTFAEIADYIEANIPVQS